MSTDRESRPRRVCVVITARPSYARVKTALMAIRDRDDLELQLVVAASALLDRYGETVRMIEKDGFEIAERVHMVLEGENLVTTAKSTGLGVVELATVFYNLDPDIVVTIADRYETLATALTAAYMNIPLTHIQGGEVSGSIDEKVRHAVTKLADLHFVCHSKAAERVLRLGEDPGAVHVTGCPSIDLAAAVRDAPDLDFDPFAVYSGVGGAFDFSDGYLIVMQHPVTTEYELAFSQATETLHGVRALDMPTFWFWPNADAGSDGTSKAIRVFRENEDASHMHFFKNMAPEHFLKLAFNAKCLVGNSSVGIRECSFFGVPVVNIGSRQQGRERGDNVIDVAHDREEIKNATIKQSQAGRYPQSDLYGTGQAGQRIAKLLAESPLTIQKRLTY